MPIRITIRDLPPLPASAREIATVYQKRPTQVGGDIDVLLRLWASLHMREMHQPYDIAYGRDVGIIKSLLRQATIEQLEQIVTFFWEHRNDDEGTTWTYFKLNYPRIVQEKMTRDRLLGNV
jgi:hypothetical protein